MSNLSVSNKTTNNDKVTIEYDSDDSFNSYYSNKSPNNKSLNNKSLNNESSIIKQPTKKSFTNKINDADKNNGVPINKNNKNSKLKSTYNKKKYTLNNKTKEILEKSYEDFTNSLKIYYDDVLEWMNLLYSDNSESIAKIKFKKMTLNKEIFDSYNKIIKKYKLDKDLFDTDKFIINDDHDRTEIYTIAKILTNNLLAKLGHKLVEYKSGDSKRLKIDYTINCY
jgi:hypothetical protein